MSNVTNISFLELIIALTVAFLLAQTSLVLLMGGGPYIERGFGSMREGFDDMLSGLSVVPRRGCGLGRPSVGDSQQVPWGARADRNAPYNTGAYPYDPRAVNMRALRSPRPLAVKGACRPVAPNPVSEREVSNDVVQSQPRECRTLPYSMQSDLPGEADLWPAPMDSADTLGFGAGLNYEGFSGNTPKAKEPAPLQALSGSSGAKYNFQFIQN